MKKKYSIAITGTFDVENYGDLLFPVVFEKAMKKRNLDFDLFLFSPSGLKNKALDKGTKLFSYRDFERLHRQHHFDALIVGGGAILHFQDISVRMPNFENYSNYRNIDSWYTIIYLAVKNGVRVFYNVPQAPFEFSQSVSALARSAFLAAEYLSVRDIFSQNYIKGVLKKGDLVDIRVCPDSVCSISRYYNKEVLIEKARRILFFRDKYVAIHFSRVMPEEVEPCLVQLIKMCLEDGFKVVLLPLGYTHGDDIAMNAFKKKYGVDCFVFSKKLSIDDMTAILAGCDLYIGTSFHGSVVAISFGNKAISFNYYSPTLKNVDNYRQFGLSEFLADNYKKLIPIYKKIIREKVAYEPVKQENEKLVEEHFDELHRLIICKNSADTSMHYQLMHDELLNLMVNAQNTDEVIEKQKNQIVEKLKQNKEVKKELITVKNELDETKRLLTSMAGDLEEYKKNYELVVNSSSWRITEPLRKIVNKYRDRKK